jgi:hypothetical protein
VLPRLFPAEVCRPSPGDHYWIDSCTRAFTSALPHDESSIDNSIVEQWVKSDLRPASSRARLEYCVCRRKCFSSFDLHRSSILPRGIVESPHQGGPYRSCTQCMSAFLGIRNTKSLITIIGCSNAGARWLARFPTTNCEPCTAHSVKLALPHQRGSLSPAFPAVFEAHNGEAQSNCAARDIDCEIPRSDLAQHSSLYHSIPFLYIFTVSHLAKP